MSAAAFERVLARLYADAGFRRDFLADPEAACARDDLTPEERRQLAHIDRSGLALAAASFARKRAAARRFGRGPFDALWRRVRG